MSEQKFYNVILFFLSILIFFIVLSLANVPEKITIYNIEFRNPDILKNFKTKLDVLNIENKKYNDKVMCCFLNTVYKDLKLKMCYPEKNFNALKNFFSALLNKKEKIHILHYGDSQIEGDRITRTIRDTLQKIFGGSGCGLIFPVKINNVTQAIDIFPSKEWRKYSFRDFNNKNVPFMGVMLNIFKFNDFNISCDKIDFNIVNLYFKQGYGNILKILYSNRCNKEIIHLFEGEKLIDVKTLDILDDIGVCEFRISSVYFKNLNLEFSGKGDPVIYGISFASETGVFVSNIGIRGSSGLEFTRLSRKLMSKMLNLLDVKLIIYQFGINVVPTMTDNRLKEYEIALTEQLRYLKSLKSDLDIIVIGITDMAKKVESEYISYPLIDKINEAQKRASLNANCVFWDALKKMGGKNTMPKWVALKPPLASKDYAHLTNEGCKIISSMFVKDLLEDFENFKKHYYQTSLKKK